MLEEITNNRSDLYTSAALFEALHIKKAIHVRVSACVTQYLQLAELLISIGFQCLPAKCGLASYFKTALHWQYQQF